MTKDEATRLVLEGFDKGVFVRDVSHDHESSWAVRQLPYLAALSHLIEAMTPAAGRRACKEGT